MKYRFPLALPMLATATALLLVGCAPRCGTDICDTPTALSAAIPVLPPVPGDGPWNLTVFHVNDSHCNFMPEPASWRDDHAPVGGVVALASHLAEQRRDAAPSLLFDGGDFMTGNPFGEMVDDGIRGAAWMDMLNLLGFDAGVIGNHEFDLGRENTRALAARADFPLMALDVRNETGELEFPTEPPTLERGDLRVGVMGVSCQGLFEVSAEPRVKGLRLDDQAETARRWAAELDPETDLLVLITHNGADTDTTLARELNGSGIDLIVGGHSHTRLNHPLRIGEILVVQAGSKMKNLGRLDLQVSDDRIVEYDGRLITLLAEGRTASPELEVAVATAAARVDAEYGRVIGELAVNWRRSSRHESNVGDWICDALRDAAGADVALLNSGTIRTNLQPGPLTLLDIHTMLPFGNALETFEIDGAGLLHIVRVNAAAAESGKHGILQVAGLRYVYSGDEEGMEIIEATVGGQPIDPERVYTVACPDYVAMQSEVYLDMVRPETRIAGGSITDVVIAAIEAAGTIEAVDGGRITRQ